jgi:uncharacterized protein (DUF2252 family)
VTASAKPFIDWATPKCDGVADAVAAGRALRSRASRRGQAAWRPGSDRPDPVAILQQSDEGRLVDLLPIRYRRMLVNPFTFYRGAAAIMASDLASLPVSGIRTQICGDGHLLNFGGFGTPENRFVFDVNDFDETTLGAWEWDVKRLVTSVIIAARHLKLAPSESRTAALQCIRAYRERVRGYAVMKVLEVWYDRLSEARLNEIVSSARTRRQYHASIRKAKAETRAHEFPSFVREISGAVKIVDNPPLLYHPKDAAPFFEMVRAAFTAYRETLSHDLGALFDRFTLRDAAYKVVGVGSVGTRCLIALFTAADDDPLVLQMKEARPSVFETYAGAPPFDCQGERVVTGQRALQAASDLFVGFAKASDGHDYYVRQLRDMKTSEDVDDMSAIDLADYADFCGWCLARAHSKASGSAAMIAGYLGRSTAFDEAVVQFAESYANQNERDYDALVDAVQKGKVKAAALQPKSG